MVKEPHLSFLFFGFVIKFHYEFICKLLYVVEAVALVLAALLMWWCKFKYIPIMFSIFIYFFNKKYYYYYQALYYFNLFLWTILLLLLLLS